MKKDYRLTSITDERLLTIARDTLERALTLMRENLVPSTPENIMVWFHHVQKTMPQLDRDLETILSRGSGFTPQINKELYQRYFTEMDSRKLELVRAAMGELLKDLSENIHELSQGMDDFDDILQRSAEALQLNPDQASLTELVDTLLQESKLAKAASERARHKLDQLNEELGQLKTSMEALERSALEDALTSTANRRAFDQVFNDYLKMARVNSRSCCLMLVDIDRFKAYNDKYGHQVGDKVLRFVALTLKKMVKGQDFVARHGGEEFAILLPSTHYQGGMAIAQAIVERIGNSVLKVGNAKRTIDPVTVSVGLSYSRDSDTPESMFKRADVSLYEAKARGRNQVVGEKDLP